VHIVIDGEIFHSQPPGGISRIYLEVLPRMVAWDQDIQWTITCPINKIGLLPTGSNVRCIPQLPTMWKGSRGSWTRVARRLNRYMQRCTLPAASIWHSTYYTTPPCSVFGIVASVYDMIFEFEYGRPHELHHLFAQTADIILFLTECTAQSFSSTFGFDRERCVVIPLAASPIFRILEVPPPPVEWNTPQRPFFLYVGGRHNAYKNFERLLRAYAAWDKRTQVDLVVVGSTWSDSESRILQQLHISENVQLLRHIDDFTLCHLYNSAHAFVYPSRYEGFGVPLLESLACECQVVASRIPSTLEVIGERAIYFDPDDTESLVAALDVAWTNPHTAAAKEAARNWVESVYSWDKTARQTLEVFQRFTR
jgi:glycosyltransferase involved in cell wall biosynthesis